MKALPAKTLRRFWLPALLPVAAERMFEQVAQALVEADWI